MLGKRVLRLEILNSLLSLEKVQWNVTGLFLPCFFVEGSIILSIILAYILLAIKSYKKKQNSLHPLCLCNPKNVTELDTPGHQWSEEVSGSHCGQPGSLQLSCHLLVAKGRIECWLSCRTSSCKSHSCMRTNYIPMPEQLPNGNSGRPSVLHGVTTANLFSWASSPVLQWNFLGFAFLLPF